MPVMRAQTSLSTSQPLLEILRCKTKYRKNINQKILKTQIQISFEIPIKSNIDIRFKYFENIKNTASKIIIC